MTDEYSHLESGDQAVEALGEPTPRLEVETSGRNPVDIADEVADHLVNHNDPPQLFVMGSTVAQLVDDGTLKPFDTDAWLYFVSKRVDFLTQTKAGPRITSPPHHAMRMVPTATAPRLPVLDGIVHTPYLDAAGDVIAVDGYNVRTRLVLRNTDVRMPDIPESPSRAQLAAAVQVLTDEWLGDFPFVGESAKANMVALLLTLTGREFFDLAPLTVIDASTAGSGKGLLINTTNVIFEGHKPHLLELPADGEEQRKKITTALLAGNDLIVWDESPVITGRTLALILTAATYSDRLLGGNKMISVANRFTQVALGNNVQVWGDLKRRVVPIRLEPDTEHPEHRSNFRHPNLERWVIEHRGELLGAVLTIWRAWLAAGRPRAKVTMGSFERWAGVVGGALECVGITGFLADTAEWLDDSDPDADGWGAHLASLSKQFGDEPFTVKQVAERVEVGLIELPYIKRDPDRSLAHIIGNAYRSVRGRWHGGHRLDSSATKNSANGARSWTVISKPSIRRDDRERVPGVSEVQGVSDQTALMTDTTGTTETPGTPSPASHRVRSDAVAEVAQVADTPDRCVLCGCLLPHISMAEGSDLCPACDAVSAAS